MASNEKTPDIITALEQQPVEVNPQDTFLMTVYSMIGTD